MTLQAEFSRALLDPAQPAPAGLKSWNGSDPAQRFGVYRNNVVVALIDALASTFPVVRALVGDAFFRDMARVFVRAHPPRSRLLMRYGEGFADFIDGFEPARSTPYLADMARLEAARLVAHHAADSPAYGPEHFARLASEAIGAARVRLHPAARVFRSDYAVLSIWSAHQDEGDLADVDPFAAEDVLIARPHFDVGLTRLGPGVADFLVSLEKGDALGDAALRAAERHVEFDLAAALHLLMTSGAVASFMSNLGDAP